MKRFILVFLLLAVGVNKSQTSYSYAPVNDSINAASWEEALQQTFGLLPKAHYPTGYLFSKTSFPAKFTFANGTANDSSFNMLEWYFIQNIVRASYTRPDSLIGYLQLDSIKEKYVNANNTLPWGVVDINGNYLRDSAFIDTALIISNHRLVENSSNLSKIYGTKKLFCVAPLNMEIYTLNPQFIILENNYFSNNAFALQKMEIDLDDGIGYREVSFNTEFQASYSNAGFKSFTSRFIYENGDTLYSNSEIEVIDPDILGKTSSTYQPYDDLYKIYANDQFVPWYPSEFSVDLQQKDFDADNSTGSDMYAEVGVWYGCGNISKKIRKPFLLFGGYNPKNGKALSGNGYAPWYNDALGPLLGIAGWRGPMYETYNGFYVQASKNASGGQSTGDNGNRFLDKLRQEGYDILIVRFHDGIGYLQNNAYIAAKVIIDLNNQILNETSNVTNPGAALDPEAPGYPNSTKIKRAKHELVVGGLSAGALSTRMGLLLIEYENQTAWTLFKNHRTKTWVAIDIENQGSNTPIGEQMFMDFQQSIAHLPANVADIANSIICKSGLDLIKHHGIATQNTLYHVSNLQYAGNSVWNVGHSADFDNYFADLTTITPANYPANLRGYPKNCYRIAVSQGNANGINQLMGSDVKLINNESPTSWCLDPAGTMFGVGGVGFASTPYRNAKGRALLSWNDNAFTCKLGVNFRTLFYSWYINFGHWKYHDNNHVQDADLGNYQPYDEATGSTLPSHILIGSKLPLSSRNLVTAAFALCNSVDWNNNQHGFSPTVSGLDLHLVGNNTLPRYPKINLVPGNVSGGLNLMQRSKYNNIFDPSPHNDFGYPHLTFPSNHYDYTPFDAIWAHGNNISTTNYDDNTMHVEDPTPYIGEFLAEEIAPSTLYLSNRTLQATAHVSGAYTTIEKYYADFEARNSILAGDQSIYEHNFPKYERQRTAPGDFVVDDGAVVTLRANNDDGASSVVLGAGFSAKHGSILRAYVYNDPNTCNPFSYRVAQRANTLPALVKQSRPLQSKRASTQHFAGPGGKKQTRQAGVVGLYPNPTLGSVFYAAKAGQKLSFVITDAVGKELEKGILNEQNGKIDLSNYPAGVYFIQIISDNFKQTDRIILQ